MYSKSKITIVMVIPLLVISSVPISSGLIVEPLPPNIKKINIPININIKFWGFGSQYTSLASQINPNLPSSIVHESYNPSQNDTSTHYIKVANEFWPVESRLKIFLQNMTIAKDPVDLLIDNLPIYRTTPGVNLVTQKYYQNGIQKSVDGFAIDMMNFSSLLEKYNDENAYTIHLLNMSKINKLSGNLPEKHWYRLGDMKILPAQDDIRNLGQVGKTGLFYDPTALAPKFENDTFNNLPIIEKSNFLTNRIIEIIEKIIIGSPYSFNFLSMEKRLQIAQIVIGNQTEAVRKNDFAIVANELTNTVGNNRLVVNSEFQTAITNLFPYLKTTISAFNIDMGQSGNGKLNRLILNNEKSYTNKSGKYLLMTNSLADQLKNVIRFNYYQKYPSGYFLAIFIFTDSNNRDIIFNSVDGEKEYENAFVGVGVLNLKDWINLSTQDKNQISLRRELYVSFGKIIGLPSYNSTFSSQIDSPMSSYGVTQQWDENYSPLEIQSLARRVGSAFNHTTLTNIQTFREDLRDSNFKYLDRSSLDDAEKILIEGNIAYFKGNYTGATQLYIQGFEAWEAAIKEINLKINAWSNSMNLVGITIIAIYVIGILRSLTITKEELIERMEKY